METKDWRVVRCWHFINVLHELGMLLSIWDSVHEISGRRVEAIVWLEDLFLDPHLTVCDEQFSIEEICDSTTILDIANHVLESLEGVWVV